MISYFSGEMTGDLQTKKLFTIGKFGIIVVEEQLYNAF